MNLESLRWSYLRHVVVPLAHVLGAKRADAMARTVGRWMFGLRLPGTARAFERLWRADAANDAATVNGLARAVYENQARFWCENLFMRRLLRERSWRCFVSFSPAVERQLTALKTADRPIVFTTAYFGNPVVAAWVLGRVFRPIHVVMDRLTLPVVGRWQSDLMADPCVRPIWRTDAADILPRTLERGGSVLLMAETERRRGPAVNAAFLGSTLRCHPTLGRLARWYEAPVVPVSCTRREAAFRFDLTIHEPIVHTAGDDDLSESVRDARVVRSVLATLERVVRRSPEQYLWSMETAPAGQMSPSPMGEMTASRSMKTQAILADAVGQIAGGQPFGLRSAAKARTQPAASH